MPTFYGCNHVKVAYACGLAIQTMSLNTRKELSGYYSVAYLRNTFMMGNL